MNLRPKTSLPLPNCKFMYFGKSKDDRGLAAVGDGKIVCAVWVRIMNDYGHIDDDKPNKSVRYYDDDS